MREAWHLVKRTARLSTTNIQHKALTDTPCNYDSGCTTPTDTAYMLGMCLVVIGLSAALRISIPATTSIVAPQRTNERTIIWNNCVVSCRWWVNVFAVRVSVSMRLSRRRFTRLWGSFLVRPCELQMWIRCWLSHRQWLQQHWLLRHWPQLMDVSPALATRPVFRWDLHVKTLWIGAV